MKKRKPKKTKKLRKPKRIMATPLDDGYFEVDEDRIFTPEQVWSLKPRQARKLASWLIRAADFLEVGK